MDLQRAIEILSEHNKWRRDHTDTVPQTDPRLLGEAIDCVVEEYDKKNKEVVCTNCYTTVVPVPSGYLCPNCACEM